MAESLDALRIELESALASLADAEKAKASAAERLGALADVLQSGVLEEIYSRFACYDTSLLHTRAAIDEALAQLAAASTEAA